MALTGKYAFKDAVDVKLYPAGTDVSTSLPQTDPTGTIVIDYLNECQLTLETDATYARIKGNNAVPFSGGKTGQFTLSAEVLTMQHLAMIMGGEYDSSTDAITVTGDEVSQGFVLVGTFRGKKHGDNSMQTFRIILYNVAPQPAVDFTLSATDIGSFDLVLDVLADEDNNIVKITPVK